MADPKCGLISLEQERSNNSSYFVCVIACHA